MLLTTVNDFADACGDREFLGGFFEETILLDGHSVHLGGVERALIESCLQHIDRNESLVIHNPFPSPSVPLAVCASYAYSQHPGIPGAGGKSLLLFASTGYVTDFDRFHFADQQNPSPSRSILGRRSIDSLSSCPDTWRQAALATANSGFIFDFDSEYTAPGAVFVDLQKPEWEDNFDKIEELYKRLDVPFIFYTDQMTPAAEVASDLVGTDTIEVTNDLLASSTFTTSIPESASTLTREEYLLSTQELSFWYFSVADEQLGDLFSKGIDSKNRLKDRLGANSIEYRIVASVFNRLTKQPFKPKYWNEVVERNPIYKSIDETLEFITTMCDRYSDGTETYLHSFGRLIRRLESTLNKKHPLQNAVLTAIRKSANLDMSSRFVIKNTTERKALEAALDDEGITIPENTSIIEISQKPEPDPNVRYIFLYPPYEDDYIYEFPLSTESGFIYNSLWDSYVRRTAKNATKNFDSQHYSRSLGGETAVKDFEYDVEQLETDIRSLLQATARTQSDGTTRQSRYSKGHEQRLRFWFSDGTVRNFDGGARLTTYLPQDAQIQRKRAKNISTGETVVLMESASQDIYTLLIDSAHQRKTIRDYEERIEAWRNILREWIDRNDYSAQEALDELCDHGCTLTSSGAIKSWYTGETLGPGNESNVRLVLALARPAFEGELLDEIAAQVWKSMQHIRFLHRRIGRNIRRAIEAEFDPTADTAVDDRVEKDMFHSLANNARQTKVEKVEVKSNAD